MKDGRDKRFAEANLLFAHTLKLRTGDKASIRMLERLDALKDPIHIDGKWDGAVSILSK